MNTVIRDACTTDEFYDPPRGCQLCSWTENGYQEILCPCEPTRDAVIGCKLNSSGNNLCRPRSAALDECARRGYTSSRAPGTTAEDGSTAVPSVALARSISAATFAGESTQPLSTTVNSIDNPSSPLSSDGSPPLALIVGVCSVLVIIAIGAVLYLVWKRRKTLRCRRVTLDVDNHEAMENSAMLIGMDSAARRGDVNGASEPLMVVINEATPCVDPKPPCVVKNYHIFVKGSLITQVGSHSVMTVGEHVASVVRPAGDLNSDEEEQMSCASDSDYSGDENDVVVGNDLNSSMFQVGSFSHVPAEQPECTQSPPVVQGGIVDPLEEEDAYPSNLEKSSAIETQTQHFASVGYSAGRPGEEERASSQAVPERTDSRTVPHRSSVAGLSDRGEGPSGSHRGGDENAMLDSSSMPTQITDNLSHQMGSLAKADFTACRGAGGQALLPSLTSFASLPNGSQCSLDSGDTEGNRHVHSPAEQPVSSGRPGFLAGSSDRPTGVNTSPVEIADKDTKLPVPMAPLHSVPLSSSVGPRQTVATI